MAVEFLGADLLATRSGSGHDRRTSLAVEPDWSVSWTPGFVAILAYNWTVTTALGYFLWNKVLAVMSPAVAGQVLTLTPISGFLLSTLIFGGAITIDIVGGILLIAIGLILTLRP